MFNKKDEDRKFKKEMTEKHLAAIRD